MVLLERVALRALAARLVRAAAERLVLGARHRVWQMNGAKEETRRRGSTPVGGRDPGPRLLRLRGAASPVAANMPCPAQVL